MGPREKRQRSESPQPVSSKAPAPDLPAKKAKTDPKPQPAWFNVTDNSWNLAKQRDTLPGTSRDNDAWAEKLAVHLALTPQFLKWMTSPTTYDQLQLGFKWLSMVYLPARTIHYSYFQNWYQAWWNRKYKASVIEQAVTIVKDRADVAKFSSIDNIRAPNPKISKKDAKFRESLYKLHATRQRIVEAIHTITNAQHALSADLKDAISEKNDSIGRATLDTDAERKEASITAELTLLDGVKVHLRNILSSTKLEGTVISFLDSLLQDPTLSISKPLTHVSAESKVTKASATTDRPEAEMQDVTEQAEELDIAAIQQKIQQAYPGFSVDYLELLADRELHKEVFTVSTATKKVEAEPLQKLSDFSEGRILDEAALAKCDGDCDKWFREEQKRFKRDTFFKAFKLFDDTFHRPDPCQKANKGDAIWRWHPTKHLDVIKDNMWHVRHFVNDLISNNLVREQLASESETVQAQIEKTLQRMFALLAAYYGCVEELGLPCSTIDRLLEDFASLLVGQVDPRMETIAMQEVTRAIVNQSQGLTHQASEFMQEPDVLETHHRARILFSEISRFYRGAVILAVAKVSATYHHTTTEQKEVWYTQLLRYCAECGHPNCKEQLKVQRMDWGKKTKDTSGAKKSKGNGNAKDDTETAKSKKKFTISIAVKDSRIGFPEERAHLSTNRPAAYPCLSVLIANIKFNVALGVFFHYFAHLYHPTCRPFRGKISLLDDYTMMKRSG